MDSGTAAALLGGLRLYRNVDGFRWRDGTTASGPKGESRPAFSVTVREIEILGLLATGKTSKQIGRQLFISPHTVDTYRRNLLKKLDCASVVELTQVAFQNALL